MEKGQGKRGNNNDQNRKALGVEDSNYRDNNSSSQHNNSYSKRGHKGKSNPHLHKLCMYNLHPSDTSKLQALELQAKTLNVSIRFRAKKVSGNIDSKPEVVFYNLSP